jgi:DNA adenine methylase
MQRTLFGDEELPRIKPFKTQLLKWVGSKQRFAHEIASYFPPDYRRYFEPFLGSGAVLGTLAPREAVGSDVFRPLVEIWQALRHDPVELKRWYADRWQAVMGGEKVEEYEKVKAAYNARPGGADLLFLCRSCYGGVVRFRKADGYMSTPCGVHRPIPPHAFSRRVDEWHRRTLGTEFLLADYREALESARAGDLVYCDPPYLDTQSILYGAQSFHFGQLLEAIARCKARGVRVALSIDGTKRSGNRQCKAPIPSGIFVREALVNCGRSMLRRFQMEGQTLESEVVADRLLLTY